MSKLPTKTMILEWVRSKRYKALENFRAVKKAEITKSIVGTEVEQACLEWDEYVRKLSKLYRDVVVRKSYYNPFRYSEGQYKQEYVSNKLDELYRGDMEKIQNEFEKVYSNVKKINSPKKILEYLKACDLEYPVECDSAVPPAFENVDATVFKPWVNLQLGGGQDANSK
ncbi:hypothetical protein SAMN05446037_100634 [Anaerovirgula multivorans]|uniref:Uncharacterized protein n=1 Tax=Anaerovirgula multivorans TaxID=312168 RepID=A0A239CMP6_9FIRM|nr:hypothetical protein [Anaerovirgula multivorans]SNS20961.1 hypothetical protein SAMN05446037_100634 [Anaerovirgula multivorans]